MEWIRYDKDKEMRIPIKSWCKNVEEEALQQAIELSKHRAIFKHICLMPDCHCGYEMPIGGVIASENYIFPFAVGFDIGCGMSFVETNIDRKLILDNQLKQIVNDIYEKIPVGFEHQKSPQSWDGFKDAPEYIQIIDQELNSAKNQLGTLGGGNHFIEIQENNFGKVCIMLHSGSRNFGYKIADYFMKLANELCETWISNIPNKKLSFLPVSSYEGRSYLEAMEFALDFAKANRTRMMNEVKQIFLDIFASCSFSIPVDIHHNYCSLEHHFGKNVYVHRKGATLARKGIWGIIPGSMATSSYLVRGLGNPESFESCSHGAGRVIGRKKACIEFDKVECDESMKNIIFKGWGKTNKGDIDLSEAPIAYKDIDKVMESQSDLVKIVRKMKPLAVVKG